MIFIKKGIKFDVKDPAHIDCFRAKGWQELKTKIEKPKPKIKK